MIRSITDEVATTAPVNSPEVDEWIRRSIQGDDEAARNLLDFLYPLVISIVRSRVPRRMLVEDLTQDVFIRIFQKLSHYSGKVPVKHWVSRVAVNICTNAYHKAKACQELRMADLGEEEAEVIQSLASSEGELEPSQSWAARELVDKLLTTLSADDRTLVDFICLQGYTYNQVRDLTGWNLSAMKVRMFRVRKRLEKTLARLSREEPLPLIHFPICRVDEALRFSCGA